MNRRSVILTAIILALIGAALPIAAALSVSWERAVASEQERLSQIADRAISRATLSFTEVGNALRSFDKLDVVPCSDTHIALMRKTTLDTRSVDEIGYYRDDGLLECTSW